ncbi:folate-binding protein YgfZ [Herbiconiux sp. L3-i23]|uniref:CAF17-like 4Fe-4S cluster assembly/insertion protein YgfZ n=1 Tax=Herbiconiux sp. L3-i23 TaxID=2905871 RepID=UPI00206705BA|nr:folate-binding protein [Herbiconiux sp. L3-i23]BDI23748.1 folate-binding protein [Herbiconiux sp. L3-i23]
MSTDPFLALPGAVDGAGLDAGVPAHYGNPIAEQRRLVDDGALAHLARGVVTVTGPDRLSWLDSLTSQRLIGLPVGASAESLLLDPNGHIEHDLRVVDDGETSWIITERSSSGTLAAFLDRMRFMLRVEVADVSDDWAVLGTLDRAVLESIDTAVVWDDPWTSVAVGGVSYATVAEHPGTEWTWHEAIVSTTVLPSVVDRVRSGEIAIAGSAAVDALRIAAWRPRLGAETDERSIPHELDWLRSAVHLAKGCYRGQETVAKVHNLGHPPRRVVLLDLDGSDAVLPAPGSPVFAERRGERVEVGQVTSSAVHYERGPIALAVVKRSVPSDADVLVVAEDIEIAAGQEIIVAADAGRAVEVPRLPRVGSPSRG